LRLGRGIEPFAIVLLRWLLIGAALLVSPLYAVARWFLCAGIARPRCGW
jgi:hypothetical protein